jgi:hypothetical protein
MLIKIVIKNMILAIIDHCYIVMSIFVEKLTYCFCYTINKKSIYQFFYYLTLNYQLNYYCYF